MSAQEVSSFQTAPININPESPDFQLGANLVRKFGLFQRMINSRAYAYAHIGDA